MPDISMWVKLIDEYKGNLILWLMGFFFGGGENAPL